VDISILGELEINDGTAPIDVGGRRERAIVETLALAPGDVVATDTLIDGAWGDDPPPTAEKSLQSHISRIRQRLPAGLIETAGHGYRLRVRPTDVDADRLVHLVEQAQQVSADLDPHFALELLDEAVDLWRGTPLDDLADGPYRAGEVARLEATRGLAISARIDAHLALGHHELMIPELERLVNGQPYREQLWSQLMLALYRSGRRTEALDRYERLRAGLRDDLGLNPSTAVRDLAARIVNEDSGLDLEPPPPVSTLPTPLSSFVGRESVGQALSDLLEAHRLVTVVGPGGVGKTRLAIEVADDRRERWADGTFFVELTGADEVDGIIGGLVAAFPWIPDDAPVTHTANGLERLLDGRSVLLVLDGAEHLADAVGDLVEHLLESAPGVTVLVTSRAPLHVPGEHLLELPPMQLPADDSTAGPPTEAVQLFLARLAARPDSLGTDEFAAIEQLCRLVDGLPLGIELMAAQAAHVPVTTVLDQLRSGRQDVLAVHRADARDSDPSLERVLEHTMQLLTAEQRALLGRLSVFRGGFDLLGVRAVGGSAAVDDFARLREVGLVLPDPRSGADRRFRLLDTTRTFAARLLTPDDHGRAERLHAEYYHGLARRLGDRLGDPTARRHLRREGRNLRAALRWFLAFDPAGATAFARVLSEFADTWLDSAASVTLFEQLLDAAAHQPDGSDGDLAWIQIAIGWPLFLTGEPARAIELTETAAATFTRLGDHLGACQAFANRAHMELLSTADQESASVWYRRALEGVDDSVPGTLLRGVVLVEAAQSLILADRVDDNVEEMLDEAASILGDTHDHHRLAHLAMDRSLAAYAVDDLAACADFARLSLHESHLAGTITFAQIGEAALGVGHLHANDLAGALDHLRRAVRMAHDDGNVLQTAIALQAVAVHHALAGRTGEAEAIWTTALTGAPLWPLFARRYPELMGPELSERLEAARATRLRDGEIAPIDRIVDAVLGDSPAR
jgi:predicted ATPase/DNA-binding SARP family transcriptional activator